MERTYWHKQGSEPLFAELEWNKPERRDQAGRLLIIGGNIHALTAPAKSYALAVKTGIGVAKIALPDKTKKLVGTTLPDAVFLPSTSSGEFSKEGIHELLGYAQWADTLLLPGDIGRNSQTAILLEELLKSYKGQINLTKDTVDLLSNTPKSMFERENTTLIVSFAQLQKLIKNYSSRQPLIFGMDTVKLIAFLHELTSDNPVSIAVLHNNQYIVASKGKISSSKVTSEESEPPHWRLELATISSCYQTWNPEKAYESITHAVHLLK